jgi:hypothetical protein
LKACGSINNEISSNEAEFELAEISQFFSPESPSANLVSQNLVDSSHSRKPMDKESSWISRMNGEDNRLSNEEDKAPNPDLTKEPTISILLDIKFLEPGSSNPK